MEGSIETSQTQVLQETFLEPERIVQYFGLEPGDHIADFGAGHGYFTIPMARVAGGDGKVYAIDIQKSVLEVIKARAKLEHLLNIETIWADLDLPRGSKLKDDFLEFVLIANILFQSEQKETLFGEVYRVLRPKGRFALIEWDSSSQLSSAPAGTGHDERAATSRRESWEDKTPAPLGPPLQLRVKKDTAKQFASQAGLLFDREFEAGSHHYGLLFVKK